MFSVAGHQLLTAVELAIHRAAGALGDDARATFDATAANRTEVEGWKPRAAPRETIRRSLVLAMTGMTKGRAAARASGNHARRR